jgi:hypothetical protein
MKTTSYSAEECRKKAADCERLAVLAGTAEARSMYADLARQWRFMATEAETLHLNCAP